MDHVYISTLLKRPCTTRLYCKPGTDFIESADRDVLEDTILKIYRAKTDNKNFYDSPVHREQVINFICNKSVDLFRLRAPKGEAFEAILTCSSIAEAQKYYLEFKDFVAKGKVSQSVKKYCPDFPKIALTYSVTENDAESEDNQKMMKDYLNDYNSMFNTKWTLENLSSYNSDLNDRLARKKGKYKVREEQLDLVIVVDRLLTGFDAPCLSTLFIDRAPMSPQNIIQAFSRTNRIFSDKKSWGQIVTFQTPALFKKAFDKALDLYSNGGGAYVQAPSYEECRERLITALSELKSFKEKPADIDISGITSTEELKQFAKLFQRFDRALAAMKTYEEWTEAVAVFVAKDQSTDQENGEATLDEEIGAVLKGVTRDREEKGTPVDIDIAYELDSVTQTQIDYEYLVALMQKYISSYDENVVTQINDPAIEKYIKGLEEKNPRLGEVIRGVWEQLKSDPSSFKGKQAIHVINDKIESIINDKISSFCSVWFVEKTDMDYYSRYYSTVNKLNDIADMDKFCYYDEYVANGGTLNKMKYRKTVRVEAQSLIEEEILPLRQR